VLHQPRSTQRHRVIVRDDEDVLTKEIVELAGSYGRYGYRRVTAMLRHTGWRVNHKRVERIWRREGLKVPKRQPRRGRLWLNDGSCVRLLAIEAGHAERSLRSEHAARVQLRGGCSGSIRIKGCERRREDTSQSTRAGCVVVAWTHAHRPMSEFTLSRSSGCTAKITFPWRVSRMPYAGSRMP
jgi:hypothetical protein